MRTIDAGGNGLLGVIDQHLARFSPFTEEHDYLSTALYGASERVKIDGDGRISLSEELKAFAGIADAVTFVGQGYKFQIWAPDRFDEHRAEAQRRVLALRKAMSAQAAGAIAHSTRERLMAGRGTENTGVAGGPARHVPVLIEPVLEFLAPDAGKVIVDGTFGAGGYTHAILDRGAQVDRHRPGSRCHRCRAKGWSARPRAGCSLCMAVSVMLDEHAHELGHAAVDGVVLDIGVSSMQLDEAERGFSFRADGPLDMRMAQEGPSAADVVNAMPVRDLIRVIGILGEERRAKAVASAIERARKEQRITRTLELARIVEQDHRPPAER